MTRSPGLWSLEGTSTKRHWKPREPSFRPCQGGPVGVLSGHLADDLQRVGAPSGPHEGELGRTRRGEDHRSRPGPGEGAAGLLTWSPGSHHRGGGQAGTDSTKAASDSEPRAAPGAEPALLPAGCGLGCFSSPGGKVKAGEDPGGQKTSETEAGGTPGKGREETGSGRRDKPPGPPVQLSGTHWDPLGPTGPLTPALGAVLRTPHLPVTVPSPRLSLLTRVPHADSVWLLLYHRGKGSTER